MTDTPEDPKDPSAPPQEPAAPAPADEPQTAESEHALEAEIETCLSTLKEIKRVDDRDRMVRHGHGLALNLLRGHRDHQGHGKPYRMIISSPQFR